MVAVTEGRGKGIGEDYGNYNGMGERSLTLTPHKKKNLE
jgi:hypothetical protein